MAYNNMVDYVLCNNSKHNGKRECTKKPENVHEVGCHCIDLSNHSHTYKNA